MSLPRSELTIASIEVIEAVLPPLIDRHLRWVPADQSPSAEISNRDYGYKPTIYSPELAANAGALRPSREPVNFSLIAAEVLGVDPAGPHFEERVRTIDGYYDLAQATDLSTGQYTGNPKVQMGDGWFQFLVREGLDERTVRDIKEMGEKAFRLNTLTEDNLPSYVMETLGPVLQAARDFGVQAPALTDWFRGIWPAEEDGHKIEMNHYGQIRRLTTTPEHVAGRTSQLRAGGIELIGGIIGVFCYTPRQEFATYVAHSRDALLLGPVGGALVDQIAKDEVRHEDLYTKVLEALINDERLASITINTLRRTYEGFVMPGRQGIPNFHLRSIEFNNAQIFGVKEDFESARHILKKVGLLSKEGDGSYTTIPNLDDKAALDLQWLRENYDKEFEVAPRKDRGEFVLGKTLTERELRDLSRKFKQEKRLK